MNTARIRNQRDTRGEAASDRFEDLPTVKRVIFLKSLIEFHLSDKRIVSIPLSWIKKLKNATDSERRDFKIMGHFVFWEKSDEIIGVKNLLNGSIVPN